MVERVARAIFWAKFDPNEDNDLVQSYWDAWADHRAGAMCQARAAIEALMEPTPEMVSATEDICVGFGGELSDINLYCDDYKAIEIFRTMLSAALERENV